MASKTILVFAAVTITSLVQAQRPFYAGRHAIGYPEVAAPELSNRFGDDTPLPLEARGDRDLVNRIERLPLDNRPFWYINNKQYDELRKNPKTYPQRPNSFV